MYPALVSPSEDADFGGVPIRLSDSWRDPKGRSLEESCFPFRCFTYFLSVVFVLLAFCLIARVVLALKLAVRRVSSSAVDSTLMIPQGLFN
jgi:hypothetical protein